MPMRFGPEPALSLASLRLVVPPLLLLSPGFREAARVAAWDRARWAVPEGLGWFVEHVPISPSWVAVAQIVMLVSAGTASLGIRARRSLVALTLSAFYVSSIAQLTGFVWHDMHLLWFAAILAASPCDDVLAFDATRPLDSEGEQYAVPLWSVRLLFACIYFFPGLHKLLTSGLAWALSDNLVNQVQWKWFQHGVVPSFRIDRHPWLLKLGGLFTLAFELGFPLLLLRRRTRALAAFLGLCFHLASRYVFLIAFPSLWLCYGALVDLRPAARIVGRKLGWKREPEALPDVVRERSFAPALVGAALLGGAALQGARGQMQSYPFACYPTFQWMAKSEMPDLEIDAVLGDGREVELVHARDAAGRRSQRSWGEIWRLVGATGPTDARRLRAYLASIRRSDDNRQRLSGAKQVRFYRVLRSVRPEARQLPPVSRKRLLEIELGAPTP